MSRRIMRCGFCGLPQHETRATYVHCARAMMRLAVALGVEESEPHGSDGDYPASGVGAR